MLSKKTKYALHALLHLTRNKNQGPIQIKTIAEEEHIPKKFLEGILLELKKKGIVGSLKGPNGGYYLIQDPKEVNLANVIRQFDGAIGLLPCVTHLYYEPCEECADENLCALKSIFKDIRDETVKILKKSTLNEVIKLETKLIKTNKTTSKN